MRVKIKELLFIKVTVFFALLFFKNKSAKQDIALQKLPTSF